MSINKKRVLYYVQSYFLDCCLEAIQTIKNHVELHLIIEISNESRNTTILNIDKIDNFDTLEEPINVLGKDYYKMFDKYLSGIYSVKFIIFKRKSSLSILNLIEGYSLVKYIKNNSIENVHFDGQSARLIYVIPFLKKENIYLTIHDPVSHSGEKNNKTNILRGVYKFYSKKIFFYSNFAMQQFIRKNYRNNKLLYSIKQQPYSFISQFKIREIKEFEYILFFGRISYYKGVDILIEVVKNIGCLYPQQVFMVTGDFSGKNQWLVQLQKEKNVQVINSHIEISQLATIIHKSKFVVCPYRDATQSGVLMTAFAMNKPVIATNVGAFPEYIKHDENGLIAEPNSKDITDMICYSLKDERYKNYIINLKKDKNITINLKDTLSNGYFN